MDLGWTRKINEIERANWLACVEVAKRNGYTASQAEACEAGSLKCDGCPWKEG